MKTRYITTLVASALLTVSLVPLGSAQPVAVRPVPEGIEVITVVAKRPEPTVASTCVNEVIAGYRSGEANAQTLEAGRVDRETVRQAIRACIEQAQVDTSQS